MVTNEITPKQRDAWNKYQDLVYAIKQQKVLFLVLGRLLKDIKDNKLYRYLGEGGFDTWMDFLNNPEIGIGSSTARLYITIYEQYVLRLGMSENDVAQLPVVRLQKLLPIISKEDDLEKAKELVNTVGLVTNQDFRQIIREKKDVAPEPHIFLNHETKKWCIEYREEWIHRDEDGKLHIVNLDKIN